MTEQKYTQRDKREDKRKGIHKEIKEYLTEKKYKRIGNLEVGSGSGLGLGLGLGLA